MLAMSFTESSQRAVHVCAEFLSHTSKNTLSVSYGGVPILSPQWLSDITAM